jgi:hypothetical protein
MSNRGASKGLPTILRLLCDITTTLGFMFSLLRVWSRVSPHNRVYTFLIMSLVESFSSGGGAAIIDVVVMTYVDPCWIEGEHDQVAIIWMCFRSLRRLALLIVTFLGMGGSLILEFVLQQFCKPSSNINTITTRKMIYRNTYYSFLVWADNCSRYKK